MKFSYCLVEFFPPLAWVAVCQSDQKVIDVLHGCFVETSSHFFVEGAWAGDFADGQIQSSDTVFGSGGVLVGGGVIFVSCTATTDFLYHSDHVKKFIISNSLPLLLALLGDNLLPDYDQYSRINMSILDGIRKYCAEIPTQKGYIRRVIHSNIYFGSGGITTIEKPLPPNFQSFDEYRNFMQNRIGVLFSNARHRSRQKPMCIFSTQSKGYDSTAINALAVSFGIDKVFTSTLSKESRSFYLGKKAIYFNDDGTLISEKLGINNCTSIDRLNFQKTLVNEHFYWAGIDNNQDMNLHQIQSFISSPTLLLTGNLGEIWYTSKAISKERLSTFNDELIRWDQAGHGLGEVRLTIGMVQVAVPFIGARRRQDILKITDDVSMERYRIGGQYDRPIPRRIAEEAGVPREMFGQMKLASIVHLPSPNIPISSALRTEFFQHLRKRRLLGRTGIWLLPFVQSFNNWVYWNNPSRYFNNRQKYPLCWYLGYSYARFFGEPLRIGMIWTRLDSFLYAFCVNKVCDEYVESIVNTKFVSHFRCGNA